MKTQNCIIGTVLLLLLTFSSCQKDPYTLYQYGQISGTVTDGQTQTPLAGVTISTNPGSASTVTDAKGNFTISDVRVGTTTLTATKLNYTQYTTQISIIENKTTTASFAMAPQSQTIGAVSITKTYPDSNSTNVRSLTTFRWNAQRSAPIDTITYQVSIIKSGTNIQKTYYNISDTTLTISGLDFNAKYYWQVSAVYNKAVVASSSMWPFTTLPIPTLAIFFSRSAPNGIADLIATDPSLSYEDTITTNFLPTAFAPVGYKNSNQILFTSFNNNIPYVYIINRDGTGPMKLSPHPNMSSYSVGNGYCFYNHGSSILYTYMNALYSLNTDGTNEQLIATAPTNRHFTNVDWCPETGQIVVRTVGPMPYQSEFYIMNNDGSNMTLLLGGVTGMLESPSFSPNGNYLVYTQDVSGNLNISGTSIQSHIFIKNLTNTSQPDIDITASNNNIVTGTNDLTPRFAPDNRQIVFISKSNLVSGDGDIYTIDIFNLARAQIGSAGSFPYWTN